MHFYSYLCILTIVLFASGVSAKKVKEMDRSRNQFNEILKPVNEFISLRSTDRREYMHHFQTVMKKAIEEVKKTSPLLNKMCKGFEFCGSYRDGLKVNKPDEYDLNIKMKLPLDEGTHVRLDGNSKQGFVRINIKNLLTELPKFNGYDLVARELGKLTSDDGYLLQNKFLSWFEGVLAKSWNNITTFLPDYELKVRKSGPAQTIDVTFKRDRSISFSVDFVVGVVFDQTRWMGKRSAPKDLIPEEKYWIAIPKPVKSQESNDNVFWIISYPAQESKLIRNKNRLKEANRFLKKIRDRRSIKLLKSYYIKTIIMLETDSKSVDYWNSPLGTVLKDMLSAVIRRYDEKCIPSYWNRDYNMLQSFSQAQLEEVSRQLKFVKRTWDDCYDRDVVIKTILTDDEMALMMGEPKQNAGQPGVCVAPQAREAVPGNRQQQNEQQDFSYGLNSITVGLRSLPGVLNRNNANA